MYLINLKLNSTKWQNEYGKQGDNFVGETYSYDNDGDVDDVDYDNNNNTNNNNNNNNSNGTEESKQIKNNKTTFWNKVQNTI